jgi:TetR/AcrR family transcriptional repressor of mexCD-oprJ operon
MSEPTTDHRRAVAERNIEAILDAAERLLERRVPATMAGVAGEASVSRVTVYAHFRTREKLLEALVERAVERATASLEAAQPDAGSAVAALERTVAASLHGLGRHVAIAEAAAQQLTPDALRRAHEISLAAMRRLVDRGRRTGEFRTDLPADWQVTSFYALLHAAGEDIQAGRADSSTALDVLTRSLRELIVRRSGE